MPTVEIDKTSIFAKNLRTLRKANAWSVGEMAQRAGVPKSTMQTALTSGHVTLDTAIRISEGLSLPLDSLIGDARLTEKLEIVQYLLQSIEWAQIIPSNDRGEVALHFQRILELICK